ncbi:MAG: hypothetical protein H6Q10_2398 [Acidobacteria bacterium]|nr:hypothetical protein [Acidobacteriota bacterium]
MNTAAVAKAYLYLNRVAEARQAAEQALAFGSTAVDLHRALFYCAVASGDAALLARERGWAAAHPGVPVLLEDEAEESVRGGRLAEAIGFMKKYEAWGAAAGLPDVVVRTRFRMARYEALCGLRERAASRVEAELQHAMGPIPRIDAVRALVSAGRFDLAEGLLDELERTPRPNHWHSGTAWSRSSCAPRRTTWPATGRTPGRRSRRSSRTPRSTPRPPLAARGAPGVRGASSAVVGHPLQSHLVATSPYSAMLEPFRKMRGTRSRRGWR